MNNTIKDSIKQSLKCEEVSKKSISLTLDESLLNDIKLVLYNFNKIADGKVFTRNALIEDAVKCYVEEAKNLLTTEYALDLNSTPSTAEVPTYFDTIILSAHEDGFNEVFLNEKCWYAAKINDNRIPYIKYLALYVTAPRSHISHIVKVTSIEQFEDTDKKIIYFEEDPVELPNAIPIGDYKPFAMRSARYTTREKLLSASEVKDLF